MNAKVPEAWEEMAAAVSRRLHQTSRFTDMLPPARDGIGPALTAKEQEAVEAQLGWKLPPLLVFLYQRIGNGGFGPGYGLMELAATRKRGFGGNAIAVLNLLRGGDRSLEGRDQPPPALPAGVLPLVYWGCTAYTLVDCRAPDLPVFSWDCDGPDAQSDWPVEDQMQPLGLGLVDWIGDWAQAAPAVSD